MGSVYAQIISFNKSPKVALLSNGNEEQKGAPEVVGAHQVLKKMRDIHFVGNVEGMDIPKGSVDVIVCEGFMGNVDPFWDGLEIIFTMQQSLPDFDFGVFSDGF